MTTTAPVMDDRTADRLSRRFASVFETFDHGDDLFAPDAFFDLNMPIWRFQLVGAEAFAAHLAEISQGRSTVYVLNTVPTASGFVHEHEEWQQTPDQLYSARRLWLCEVRDGRISAVVGYCTGGWDAELRARHAVEAPMVRP